MKIITVLLLFLPFSSIASETELADAAEGAPRHITDMASYMVWKEGRFVLEKKGSNDFVCLVLADRFGRFEPSCLKGTSKN